MVGRVLGEPRPVRGDQHVGAERLAVLGAQLAQARGAGLLAHLDQPFGVEAELAALGENGREGGEVDRVLALVVGGAAAPIAPVGLVELPGVAALLPASFEAANDVAMAVAEHGRVQRAFDALGEQERPLRLGMGEDAAGKAQRSERRLHLVVDIAAQVRAALRALALRRDRDAAREIGLEGAAVEVAFCAGDGALPAHCAVAKSAVAKSASPVCRCGDRSWRRHRSFAPFLFRCDAVGKPSCEGAPLPAPDGATR